MNGLARLASDEVDVLAEFDSPAEPGFEGRVIRSDVGTPGAVALFEPQRFNGAIAGRPDAEFFAGLHEGIEDSAGCSDRNVQLPAEFADIGDA